MELLWILFLYLAENGKFQTNGMTPGEFYFYSVKDFYPELNLNPVHDFKYAFGRAETFGQWVTKRHFVNNEIIKSGYKLNKKLSKEYHQELSSYNCDLEIFEEDSPILHSIIEKGFISKWNLDKSRNLIHKKIDRKERGGFVVYLSKKLFDDF